MKNKVAIFCGGKSLEHEISIITAFDVLNSLNDEYEGFIVYIDKNNNWYTGEYLQDRKHYQDLSKIIEKGKKVSFEKKESRYYLKGKWNYKADFNVAFLCVHGKGVEDGTLSALMEYYDIPYVGNSILSSSLGQDKWLSKFLLHSVNVPILPCFYIDPHNYDEVYLEKKINNIGFPLIVKANNLGSSIGIKKVNSLSELREAINLLAIYDNKILIEKCLVNFYEINQAITIQNNEVVFSIVEEIKSPSFYDYNDKYINPSSVRKVCKDQDLIDKVSILSTKIYKNLGLNGIVRIDYLFDLELNRVYFSEVNTIPGSMSKNLFEANGIMFDELLNSEIQKALSNNFKKNNNIRYLENDIMKEVLNVNGKK